MKRTTVEYFCSGDLLELSQKGLIEGQNIWIGKELSYCLDNNANLCCTLAVLRALCSRDLHSSTQCVLWSTWKHYTEVRRRELSEGQVYIATSSEKN